MTDPIFSDLEKKLTQLATAHQQLKEDYNVLRDEKTFLESEFDALKEKQVLAHKRVEDMLHYLNQIETTQLV